MYDFTWWFFFLKLLLTGNPKSDWFVLSSHIFYFLSLSYLSLFLFCSCSFMLTFTTCLNWQYRGPLSHTNNTVDLIMFWLQISLSFSLSYTQTYTYTLSFQILYFLYSCIIFWDFFHETLELFHLTMFSAPCWISQ